MVVNISTERNEKSDTVLVATATVDLSKCDPLSLSFLANRHTVSNWMVPGHVGIETPRDSLILLLLYDRVIHAY